MSDPTSVSVAVRVRPLVDSEKAKGCIECLETIGELSQIVIRGDKRFSYNYVFGIEDTQAYFYETSVKHLIAKLFKGYNVTILAYGQTGSGKTYSMGTCYDAETSMLNDAGVIPRAISDIFEVIEERQDLTCSITVSFMELYKEQLFDLLSNNRNQVDIREENKGIKVANLTEISVESIKETTDNLKLGSDRRATGATAMNAQSSRSHAIFTITVHQQKGDDLNTAMTSKFHLVDLAGSERSKKTLAVGERLKEGININKGLLALGNVISALGDETTSKGFISYRDSKLTRLLQDSLGGNSITLMIACVSPADYNLEETISTLRYADRARKIKNKPVINQDPRAAELVKYKLRVQELLLELANRGGSGGTCCPPEHHELQTINAALILKVHRLEDLRNEATILATIHQEHAMVSDKSSKEMFDKLSELQAEYGRIMESLNHTVYQDTCPPVIWEQLQKLKDFQLRIEDLQAMHTEYATEMKHFEDSARDCKTDATTDESYTDILDDKEIEKRHEEHSEKDRELQLQMQDLDKKLALKEDLAEKLRQNSKHFRGLRPSQENAMKEMEDQILSLQQERDGLANELKNMQGAAISSKLAEQRRKKLQELEQKIASLTKKITEQAKVIKMNEQSTKKIDILSSEILGIKREKVKLVRQIRVEGEGFRDWKKKHLQEISRLKDQNRKRQVEMVKMERLHSKQHNVMKRKWEEVAAANKRLMKALSVQKTAKERRKNNTNAAGNRIQTRLAEEIEFAVSLFEAQRTLEQIIEDRTTLHNERVALEVKIKNELLSPEDKKSLQKELKRLTQEIDFRSSQIADLQQKIIDSNLENDGKLNLEDLPSPDAKLALKYLFEAVTETKRDASNKDDKIKELEDSCNAIQQTQQLQQKQHEQELKKKESLYRDSIICMEKEHQEKIFVLLRQLQADDYSDDPHMERFEILQQEIVKMEERKAKLNNTEPVIDDLKKDLDKLRAELQKREMEVNLLMKQRDAMNASNFKENHGSLFPAAVPLPKNRKPKKDRLMIEEILFSDDDDGLEDDPSHDPDWQKTPIFKRLQKMKPNETIIDGKAVKRNSNGDTKCACHGKCHNRLCGCRKMSAVCNENCKCNRDICENHETVINDTKKTLFESFGDSDNASIGSENTSSDEGLHSFKKPRELVEPLKPTETNRYDVSSCKFKKSRLDDHK